MPAGKCYSESLVDGLLPLTNSLAKDSSRFWNEKIGFIKSVILNLYSLEGQGTTLTNFNFTTLCQMNRFKFPVAVEDSRNDVSNTQALNLSIEPQDI